MLLDMNHLAEEAILLCQKVIECYNECSFELRLNAKTVPIPVVFHNLKGYDGHLLMQAMSRINGE